MARSTGPILAAAGITVFTDVVIEGRQPAHEARVVVGAALAAGGLALLENVSEGLAIGLAWLALATVLLVRTDPNTPSPVEAFNKWYNAK